MGFKFTTAPRFRIKNVGEPHFKMVFEEIGPERWQASMPWTLGNGDHVYVVADTGSPYTAAERLLSFLDEQYDPESEGRIELMPYADGVTTLFDTIRSRLDRR
jgi:hypothetical protein